MSLTTLMAIVVLARFYVRWNLVRQLGKDDYVTFVSAVSHLNTITWMLSLTLPSLFALSTTVSLFGRQEWALVFSPDSGRKKRRLDIMWWVVGQYVRTGYTS